SNKGGAERILNQEEIDSLRSAEADWLADPSKASALTSLRRSFHTLKGSGRLVGANVLGEFAWKVEDMLNRVLDDSIEPSSDVQAVVRHAIDALPQLLEALKNEGMPSAPLGAIMQAAEQLGAGTPARVEDFASKDTETVRRIERRRVPRAEADAQNIPVAAVTDAETLATS
ncbi:MAG: Hpt domain-containing protein, partial [Rhodanobacter sp.]